MSKITESGGILANLISNLGKKSLLEYVDPLPKDILPQLKTRITSPVILKERYVDEEPQEQEKDSLYSFQIKI